MTVKRISIIIWISILVAWCFDQLFWQKTPGISFPILVVISLIAGYVILQSEGKTIALTTWLLLPPVLFFSVMFTYRAEGFTRAIDVIMTFLLLVIIGITATGGRWWMYNFSDYVVKPLHLVFSALSGVLVAWINGRKKPVGEDDFDAVNGNHKPANGWAIFRGVLLAIPIVLVLASLLAAGDPVFNQYYQEFLKRLDIDNLPEYLFRLFYILVLGYMLAGAYIHSVTQSDDSKLFGIGKPWMPAFLGWTEAIVILGAVNTLFLTFILAQVTYLFGGSTNIHIDGYTYAEYARKGFVELLVVAFISLLLLQLISAITRRNTKSQTNIFSGLSISLVALVVLILISAFQRLSLYKDVYGFTRIRIFSELFMIWLAVLLLVTAVLEFVHKERYFAFACLLAGIGFVTTVNVINVDYHIVSGNIERALNGSKLDGTYLATLSEDSIPYMVESYQANTEISPQIGAVLRCWQDWNLPTDEVNQRKEADTFWGAYHFGITAARQAIEPLTENLVTNYPLLEDTSTYQKYTLINGERIDCPGWSGWD